MSRHGAVTTPTASQPQAPNGADAAAHAPDSPSASVFAASAATSSSQVLVSSPGATNMPAGTAPFKSAFGAVSAPDAAKPAAAPSKSAFGAVSAPDAAKPAAAPSKSAFGGVGEWSGPMPPIGSAVKSSCGSISDEVSAMCSLNSSSEKLMSGVTRQSPKAVTAPTGAARAEAAGLAESSCVLPERVWRCVVCHKVKDLKGPHLDGKASVRSDCWPCGKKTTFVQEDSGDGSLVGADRRASRLAEAAGGEGAPVLRELRSTVFKTPVVPSESEEQRYMLPVTRGGGAQGSVEDTSVVVLSGNALWRCAVCHKVKDLKGPHLDGKASVRSDCWPCGKKTTFLRDASAMSRHGAVTTPTASQPQAPNGADAAAHAPDSPSASVFAASAATSSSQVLVSSPGATNMPAGTAPSKSAFGAVSAPDAAKPAAAPFKSAFGGISAPDVAKPAAAPFKSAFGAVSAPDAAKPAAAPSKSAFGAVSAPDAAKPAAAPSKSAFGGVGEWSGPMPPIGSAVKSSCGSISDEVSAMCSLNSSSEKLMSGVTRQSPKAVTAPTGAARAEAAGLAESSCVLPERVWRCVVCHKVKDLKGPHLDGKASVRSDCWPCGKKTTFVQEDSGDGSLVGADRRASRLAEAAGGEGAPVLRELRSTVFKTPVVPSESEEQRYMLPVTRGGGAQGSVEDTSVVVLSGNALWRCAVCHKVKDLKGPHLDGKASVRSDCWPCGKKTTFLRDASAMSRHGAVTTPTASQPQAPNGADAAAHAPDSPSASVFAASAATSSSQVLVSSPGATNMPAGTAPSKSAFGAVSAPDAAKPAAAPFKSAFGGISAPDVAKPAAAPFKSAFGAVSAPDAAKPAAAPFKSAFGGISAPDAAKPAAAPFKSAFGDISAPDVAKPAAAPFKSAFGAVSAPDAAKPAAAPSKSAFGAVSAPDAAKPAAAPFKSAFGAVSAPDAAKPAAAPSKSAFGAVSAPDAAKPAAAPFKSAFGAVSAPDAAKPAAAPSKSAFGAVSAPDAAKPAAAPFKSAFGDISAPDVAKPAAAPFKSAFGAVSAPDAAKPAAAPFKSAFGAVSAPDAAKPAAAPFKSAFGAVSAPDAAKPAAAPSKSAFGAVSAPDAAKPAAAPFKSAFGAVSAPDAAKPAAAPFKSAFGAVSAPDAAKPAAAPSKSAFGAVSAPDAAKPAAAPSKSAFGGVGEWSGPMPPIGSAVKSSCGSISDEVSAMCSLNSSSEKLMSGVTRQSPKAVTAPTGAARAEAAGLAESSCVLPERVWRCVVCHKVKDLKGPHLDGKASVRSDCWPCGKKTTFVQEDSGDGSLVGADRRASRLAEAAGGEGAPVLRELRSTVFKTPVVPSESEEQRYMLPVTRGGGAQGSVEDTSVVVLSGNALWRCAVCHKVKDLKGPHLDGKASVRSDCWPCGKKTTFLRDASAMSRHGAVTTPTASQPQAPNGADAAAHAPDSPSASVFAASAATSSSQVLVSSPGATNMPAGTAPSKSAFGAVSAPDAAKPAAAPFKSAFGAVSAPDAAKPAAAPSKSAFGDISAPDVAKPAAAPFKSAFGAVSAPDAAKPAAAPFKSAFGAVSAPDAAKPAAAPSKSAFGDISAPDVAKPAAAPFKSAFGAVSAPDAAKPAAAPFKSAFGGISAPDAAKPAAAPSKSAFGAVSAPDAAKPAAAPSKSAFGAVSAPDAAKPAAAPSKSAFGAVSAPDAAKPAAAPFKSAFGGISAPDAAKPAAAPSKSAFGAVSAPDAAKPAAAPFKSAFGAVSAPDAAKPAAAPSKSAFGAVSAPDAAKPAAAPFKSAFGAVSAPDAAKPAAAQLRVVYDDTYYVSDFGVSKDGEEFLQLNEDSNRGKDALFVEGRQLSFSDASSGAAANVCAAGPSATSSWDMAFSNALVPSAATGCCSSAVVEKLINKALKEQRVEMKEELEFFRKDLLFEVRQAISQGHVHAVAKDRACFEEPPAQMTESLIRRHLSKAFRKS
ncbi:Nucleoporin NUP149 [Leishmania donovani]|uniref:Hypothetical_protein_conserved n=1 Tax=Leishmania donovani TaxID=5661 RepID=A0A6J8FEY8_LEIDO|nr:Nucleoporin NUP149 [Leishmania donovani]VDZ46325.1 hypothetical_protein_conserved [Leishmania donovani]